MFEIRWLPTAQKVYESLRDKAEKSRQARAKSGRKKSTKDEGLFKQVYKTLELLSANPKYPGLQTHEFSSLPHPYKKGEKVFEAYAQNRTPGAYRVFWCYGPEKGEITIIAITPHP
jgi:hypothetical protein